MRGKRTPPPQLSLFGDSAVKLDLAQPREARVGSVEAQRWGAPQAGPWALSPQGWTLGEARLPCLVGVDEAGRGPLAGPVSVAAVALSPDQLAQRPGWLGRLDDSKKLSEAKRAALFGEVVAGAQAWAVVHVHAPHIDAVNILQATFHGMCVAVELLLGLDPARTAWVGRPTPKHTPLAAGATLDPAWYADELTLSGLPEPAHSAAGPCLDLVPSALELWIDGDKLFKAQGAWAATLDQRPQVKGDALSLHIAAASILAKVSRDAFMERAEAHFPGYGLGGHKGYPTEAHREAVARLGLSPLHRKSFRAS